MAKKKVAKKKTAAKKKATKKVAKKKATKKVAKKKATKKVAKKNATKKVAKKKATKKVAKKNATKKVAKKKATKKVAKKKAPKKKPALIDGEAKELSPLDRRLMAGGLLPLDREGQVSESRRVDRVSARSYCHPGLDAPVVRLVPDPIAAGEDVALAVLGFAAPEVQGPLALRARRSLGFPAWALANDPKRARHALDVLKEFRQIAKRARTKPGEARDRFMALSRQLGRSVPHFLPTFLEEAGRVFLLEGNQTYAAQFFGAARESERTHGLELDLDRLQAVALEFALAGALTVKALTTYAEELTSRADPDVAYRHFRELCVRRSRGGLPPWPSVLADLRRLAKAAGRDATAEEGEFLKTLLRTGGGIEGAAKGFWTKAVKPISRLVAEEEVLGTLLELFPRFESDTRTDWWLEKLEGWGALDALAAGLRSPARWFNRVLVWSQSWSFQRSRRLLGVLRRLAPTMIAEGTPLEFAAGSGWRGEDIDADLLDLALELGVPVAPPRGEDGQARGRISLSAWAEVADDEREERPRPLAALCADERFQELLVEAVGSASGEADFDRAASGSPGLTKIRRAWLERIISRFASGGLPDAAAALSTLKAQAKSRIYADLPEALEPLAALDLAPVLGRSLRAGTLEELGWPELESLLEAAAKEERKVELSGHFPYLIVSDQAKATVLGPEGKVLEHELRLPAGAELSELLYVGDQLRVGYRTKNYDWKAYWSRDPKAVFKGSYSYRHFTPAGPVARLEDGATSWGGPALTPGDTRPSAASHHARFVHDGQTWWQRSYGERGWSLREFSPRSGQEGRWSLPSWLEDFGGGGWEVEVDSSWVLPVELEGLRETLARSPLGASQRWIGWRVRKRQEPGSATRWESEAPDGRRFQGRLRSLGLDDLPIGLLDLPGLEAPLPVSENEGLTLWSPEGTWRAWQAREEARYQSPDVPSEVPWRMSGVWLSLLVPRDREASLALRQLSDEAAGRLLAAARADRAERAPKASPTLPEAQLAAALTRELPALKHAGLRRGLAELLDWAAALAKGLENYVARAQEGPRTGGEPAARKPLGDEEVEAGAKGLIAGAPGYCWGGSAERQWRGVRRFFESGELLGPDPEVAEEAEPFLEEKHDLERPPPMAPASSQRWEDLLGREASLAYRAASPGFSDEERARALQLLRALAESAWVEGEPEAYRRCSFSWDRAPDLGFDWLPVSWGSGVGPHNVLARHAGNSYLIRFEAWDPQEEQSVTVMTLEDKASGSFVDLPGAAELKAEVVGPGLSRAELTLLADAVAARGPWAPEPAALELMASAGLGKGQAALVLLGFPGLGTWEQNFLPKGARSALGLKVAEAANAKEALSHLEPGQRARVLAQAAREVLLPACAGEAWPEDLVPQLAASLARAWSEACGEQVAIPEEALLHMDRLKTHADERALLTAVLDSEARAELLAERGLGQVWQTEQTLAVSCRMLSLFHQELPAGHSFLRPLADYGRALIAHLAEPDLLLSTGNPFQERYDVEAQEVAAFMDEIGGEPFVPDQEQGVSGRDEGVVVAIQTGRGWAPVTTAFRPGALLPVGDHPLLRKLDSLESPHRGTLRGLRLVERWRGAGTAALLERLSESPLEAGRFEADPRASAPELVEAARAPHDLSEEGATLYLQLLTLAAPSDRNLRRYNDWSAALLKRATAELAGKKLVVLAKRARAGRKAFLPGGWESFASPDLPVETWKLSLYEASLDAEGRWRRPLETLLPPRPLHELFALAWERAQGDDPPRYEEVT